MPYLSTVDKLNGRFPEDEINKHIVFEGTHKLGLVQPLGVVLAGPQC